MAKLMSYVSIGPMPRPWQIAAGVAIVLLLELSACGGSAPEEAAIRVGTSTITRATVDHWALVMDAGRASAPAKRDGEIRQQALTFLISSSWLIGEAASHGIGVSDQEVQQRLAEMRRASFPGGEAEFKSFLKASRKSIEDVELEARAELASSKLRRLAGSNVVAVTRAEIARYFARHRQRFVVPERREAEFTNRKTTTAADRAKREAESGKSLPTAAQRRVGEVFLRASTAPGRRDALERAIYASRPNTISGPFRVGPTYYLLDVRRVFPAITRTLAQVEGQIRKQLVEQGQRRALARLVKAWRAEWVARTDCSPGYVTSKCRQYRGPATPEDPLAFD
jgi:foldase protein PrsA